MPLLPTYLAALLVAAGAVASIDTAPIADADPCPVGQMALDGSCIPMSSPQNQNSAAAAEAPQGPVGDGGPSLNEAGPFNPGFFDPNGIDSVLAEPGFNAGRGR
jgi:hypothetical protein